MLRLLTSHRHDLKRLATLAGGIAALPIMLVLQRGFAVAFSSLVIAGLLVLNLRLHHRLGNALADGSSEIAPDHDPRDDEMNLVAVSRRPAHADPSSGLPLRDALLARMEADQCGLLGALAFADFDRLSAFDPELGERVFAALVARLRQMLPSDRLVAQVDSGQIGLWFNGGDDATARAELEAISYALGSVIDIDGQEIIPQIKLRIARLDPSSGCDARGFLARTLASFTMPANEPITSQRPTAGYVELARDRYALERDLRHAVERRELSLSYQPLIDASQGRVSGAEALMRWDHPERGQVLPARFVPIIETMGLASELGMWVLNAAAREAQSWRSQGLDGLKVAVNVSSLQLERDDLPVLVLRTLQHHDLPATSLELELTESIATSDTRHCQRIFHDLRAMGVELAVDDFGTGYSGFSSLRTLAFDKIKIDREFVTDVDRRGDSQAICQSITALGRGLGIRVLAEGVERREEYEWLRRHGCQHFQGYYFGKPMNGAAFAAFVQDTGGLARLLRLDAGPRRIEERLRA